MPPSPIRRRSITCSRTKSSVQTIGDTTVVCWAEGAEPVYQDYAQAFLFGGETPKGLSDNDLRAALKRLADGKPCDDLGVDPNRPFYILGLAPNALACPYASSCATPSGG